MNIDETAVNLFLCIVQYQAYKYLCRFLKKVWKAHFIGCSKSLYDISLSKYGLLFSYSHIHLRWNQFRTGNGRQGAGWSIGFYSFTKIWTYVFLPDCTHRTSTSTRIWKLLRRRREIWLCIPWHLHKMLPSLSWKSTAIVIWSFINAYSRNASIGSSTSKWASSFNVQD